MFTLFTGVNYTKGSMEHPEIVCADVDKLGEEIKRIIGEEKDAESFVFSISVKSPE